MTNMQLVGRFVKPAAPNSCSNDASTVRPLPGKVSELMESGAIRLNSGLLSQCQCKAQHGHSHTSFDGT